MKKNNNRGIHDFYKQREEEQKLYEAAKGEIEIVKDMLKSPNSLIKKRVEDRWDNWRNGKIGKDEGRDAPEIATRITEAIAEEIQLSQESQTIKSKTTEQSDVKDQFHFDSISTTDAKNQVEESIITTEHDTLTQKEIDLKLWYLLKEGAPIEFDDYNRKIIKN